MLSTSVYGFERDIVQICALLKEMGYNICGPSMGSKLLRPAADDNPSSQYPEGTTPPHPDMQCRVFILRWADSCLPQPQMPTIAQTHIGMTWLATWSDDMAAATPPKKKKSLSSCGFMEKMYFCGVVPAR